MALELNAPVIFLGGLDRSGVDLAMRGSHVLLHPASEEPFGMSMLEALAVGTPVIAAASNDLGDVFKAYEAVILAEDRDVERWADEVETLLCSDELQLALLKNSSRMLLERF